MLHPRYMEPASAVPIPVSSKRQAPKKSGKTEARSPAKPEHGKPSGSSSRSSEDFRADFRQAMDLYNVDFDVSLGTDPSVELSRRDLFESTLVRFSYSRPVSAAFLSADFSLSATFFS